MRLLFKGIIIISIFTTYIVVMKYCLDLAGYTYCHIKQNTSASIVSFIFITGLFYPVIDFLDNKIDKLINKDD